MYKWMKKMLILISFVFIILLVREIKFKENAQAWKNNPKPEPASYLNLDQDQAILNDLSHHVHWKTSKPMDPLFFTKPTIFNPVQE